MSMLYPFPDCDIGIIEHAMNPAKTWRNRTYHFVCLVSRTGWCGIGLSRVVCNFEECRVPVFASGVCARNRHNNFPGLALSNSLQVTDALLLDIALYRADFVRLRCKVNGPAICAILLELGSCLGVLL